MNYEKKILNLYLRLLVNIRVRGAILKGKTLECNRYLKPDIIRVVFCESALVVQHERKPDAAVIRRHRLASWNARCRTVLAFIPIPMSQIPVDLLTRGNMNESCLSNICVRKMHESNPTIAEKHEKYIKF